MDGSAGMNLGQWWVKLPIPALLPNSLMGTPDDYRGCLLGGAIGDALGRPMEGKSLERIRSIFHRRGPRLHPSSTLDRRSRRDLHR